SISAGIPEVDNARKAGLPCLNCFRRQVVFSDPYMESEMNRWTSPELDEAAASLRTDISLRLNASRLKEKFMTSCEALIHADLHTGSVMAMEGSTQVL
ncbi:unnamed protein product, partial [Scytosiphon promiscuus]